jgi:hypothetical protein
MNFKTIELISFSIVILVIFGLFLLCYIGYTDNKNKEQKIKYSNQFLNRLNCVDLNLRDQYK